MKSSVCHDTSPASMVAPLVGAWIEIFDIIIIKQNDYKVAPLVGAWIEIIWGAAEPSTSNVAPLVGAWIEIDMRFFHLYTRYRRSSCRSVD